MNKILEILKEQGRSQIWLANKIGKSYNMVNGYAKNRRQPSVETLIRIAECLEIEPNNLIKSKKPANTNHLKDQLIDFMTFAINAEEIPEHSTKELIVKEYLNKTKTT